MRQSSQGKATAPGRNLLAFGLIVVVVIASVGFYSLYVSKGGPTGSSNSSATSTESASLTSTSRTSTSVIHSSQSFVKENVSASADSISGLKLILNLDAKVIRMYQPLSVGLEEVNTSPQAVNVSAAQNWPIGVIGSGGCGSPEVVGIALFLGNLTKKDLPARSSQVGIGNAAGCLPGWTTSIPHSYLFQPGGSSASEAYACEVIAPANAPPLASCGCSSNPCATLSVKQVQARYNTSVSKYFLVSVEKYGNGGYLYPGVYTLAGADEWGAVAILHFEVADPACPLPTDTQSSFPPFADSRTVSNGSWTFRLELNSTFVFRDQGLHVYVDLRDSNLTDLYFPHIMRGTVFYAGLQFISRNGTVAWTYPSPGSRLSLTYLNTEIPMGELDVTSATMSLLQSNQTYTVVAKPLLFVQPDQPYPLPPSLEIRMSLTVC